MFDLRIHHADTPDGLCDIAVADGLIVETGPALTGRARDWNWHNTVGFWCAPVLIILTLTALPISFRWAAELRRAPWIGTNQSCHRSRQAK